MSNGLPSGTVSMLFSDIEGSTMLLTRLGASYANALDDQRRLLRSAWKTHGGSEMGTEGDSFFVVFATAEAAVAAADQAQRGIATHAWPEGGQVRVRMGIHTGSPVIHDGGYVGIDVHRAARVAAAAHGGQVVLSAATAHLVRDCLPAGTGLLDLGTHRLKDMPAPEQLVQLRIDGLQADFPPLKTLGAASSLPVPGTPMVGRDGEIAELTQALGSPDVRLVTLTGPGGSGKTRLAIGVAERLTVTFPDGIFFVALAGVTTAEAMWAAIGETLDVPPALRMPPTLFKQVASRRVLFVLDNLEQVDGAAQVVYELLQEAPRAIALATSRRPLHVSGEHEHAVPPLELPDDEGLDAVGRSGAVLLFVQRARRVRSAFVLTADNAADVAAVCRRLDGLPLAVELAAARTKLLSPHALLARLDGALDIAASGAQGPSRQKSLRDTIGWSYELLTTDEKAFFRCLGVFAGGADLAAIEAVASVHSDAAGADVLDLVAALVDASLVTIAEAIDGEPRVGMLETIRAYAYDQLAATGELPALRDRHAHHYLQVAEEMGPLLRGNRYMEARARLEAERDNFRESLTWALDPDDDAFSVAGVQVALRLCTAVGYLWTYGGNVTEGQIWLERAIDRAGGTDSPELARCLYVLANKLRLMGDLDRARESAASSVSMSRRLGDTGDTLAPALRTLAVIESDSGHPVPSRELFEEALQVARASGDRAQVRAVLGAFAALENFVHDHQRAIDLDTEALAIARELGDSAAAGFAQHDMACGLRMLGRVEEARRLMHDLIPQTLRTNESVDLMNFAEDYAAILADLDDPRPAVRLLGAADAARERFLASRDLLQQAELDGPIAKTHAALPVDEWDDLYTAGRLTTVEDALDELLKAGSS